MEQSELLKKANQKSRKMNKKTNNWVKLYCFLWFLIAGIFIFLLVREII
jgi:hypothetical protein